jgi:ABC-type Zn uptake system ZnuABC Zn-binding protein ZnuA
VEVQTVVPAGMEPHDYEPTPKEIGSMYDADIVVYHGSGIDAWADKIRFDPEKKKACEPILIILPTR